MNEHTIKKRATVHDVAREAGVSLATVDRVLNGRRGVRQTTIDKVEAAVTKLEFRRDLTASLLARARDIRVHVLLPDGTNQFMTNLATALERQRPHAATERMRLTGERVRALDSKALAAALAKLTPANCDCAIIVANDDDETREAVAAAQKRGVAVLTLVSDLPGSVRHHFIGINNAAAGRTAASLMGRFCPQGGKIGLLLGAKSLRDHMERLSGFKQVVAAEYPDLELIGPVEGRDDAEIAGRGIAELLAAHPDLKGIYSMGAGNSGLVNAVTEAGRQDLSIIAHELTESTREALKQGVVDIVIDQNPEGEIRAALNAARQIVVHSENPHFGDPIEIGIFLRDNMR